MKGGAGTVKHVGDRGLCVDVVRYVLGHRRTDFEVYT